MPRKARRRATARRAGRTEPLLDLPVDRGTAARRARSRRRAGGRRRPVRPAPRSARRAARPRSGSSSARRGRVAPAVAQQEAADPLAGDAAVALDLLARPHEVAQRLFGGRGHAHRDKLAGAVQPGEVARVDAVGLDAHAGASRDQRGRDHVAGEAERADEPVGVVAGGAGLVAGRAAPPGRGSGRAACAAPRGCWGSPARHTRVAPGRSTATAIVSLCTSSPMCVSSSMAGPSVCRRRGPNPADDPRIRGMGRPSHSD